MAIRRKFDGDKVINRCSRGSWRAMCFEGALRKHLGSYWSPISFQTFTFMKTGKFFNLEAKSQFQKIISYSKYQENPTSKMLRIKRKVKDVTIKVII